MSQKSLLVVLTFWLSTCSKKKKKKDIQDLIIKNYKMKIARNIYEGKMQLLKSEFGRDFHS